MMIMGHRGAAALEPENTLLSIRKAMEIGVDAVEIDVHLSKDKEIVVMHDSTLDRTTNGTGPVNNYTLSELKKYDAGKGETIPTLQQVMELTDKKVSLVIELKEKDTEKIVVEQIKKNKLEDNVYVISFWHRLVKNVKEMDGNIKTGVLLVGCPVDTSIADRISADVLVMKYTFVDAEFVELSHKNGLKVFIWNIDDPNLVKPFADMGVDGIGSNNPGILVDYFRQSGIRKWIV
ncbi:MAG: glycerophosphodiester phosphodiesterase [Proteobacteria bacterium]|nr:glycerophosphodiester phosphodiesterase [Desulfobacteraceae bacterium]MBU4013957.1 glycerophosphodiester phosphodiesterase [Pseudomonadota bacterium]MBU4066801.1 glycerophosphodiester phosphodiesterase [Pseudomonadota bacterium]MBU4100534.1 glycerophosphodiester phosphodiesterase [Pseudomonadota bacterium]MBU4387916.1 glycerophosphodiester phosphodiesterase [Pseudomonadota bacterium]